MRPTDLLHDSRNLQWDKVHQRGVQGILEVVDHLLTGNREVEECTIGK